MLPSALKWGYYCFFIFIFCISIWQVTNEICLLMLNCFVLLLSHKYIEGWDNVKKLFAFLGRQMNVTVILICPWWNAYSMKGKALDSCLNHSTEILFMQEAAQVEMQRELAQIFQCGQGVDVQNCLRSKQSRLHVSAKKDEGFLKLDVKICVCLPIFGSPPHFLIWAEFRQRMPDCPWNLNFLYSKNMKPGSWESNKAQTSKDPSLIFQTPVVSLSLEKAFWQPRFAGLMLV